MNQRVRAVVRRVWDETPKHQGVILEVSEEVARTYSTPGQYVVVHAAPDHKIFLTLAGAPGELASLELLLGSSAAATLALEEGREIELDPPQGRGFPLELAESRDLLMFAMGSGISALRPVIEVARRDRARYGRVLLYAGAHTELEHPYRAQAKAWQADGVEIVRANSKPWVQDLFAAEPVPLENAVAFLCGSKAMVQATTELLERHGLSKERIKLNF